MENESLQYAFRVAELIRLYREQKLSGLDEVQFQAWLDARQANRDLLDEWDDNATVDKYIESYLSVTDAETAFETKIASRLYRQDAPERQYQGYWLTGLAASVLTAALVTSLWYFRQGDRQPAQNIAGVAPTGPTATAPLHPALAAGKHRAILTMADGHRFVLDSLPVGWVALEGGTHITKKEEGVLGYDPTRLGRPGLNTVTTPRGGMYKVLLPDGTVAWLNAASSLRFPVAFDGHTRKVTLSGEGYFEVTQQKDAPFFVHVDQLNTDIQVLGTRFDVLAYEDEPICKTTVLDGSVKVTAGTGASGTLQKGQQAQSSRDGSFRVMQAPDAADAVAWTNDRLPLNRNITAIMRDISRWYDVTVEYRGDMTGHSFGGSIPRDSSLAYVLKVLESTGSIHFTLQKRRIIVTP